MNIDNNDQDLKIKETYLRYIRVMLGTLNQELNMSKYEEIGASKYSIFTDSTFKRRADEAINEDDPQTKSSDIVVNTMKFLTYFDSIFTFQEALVLDGGELRALLGDNLDDALELLNKFLKRKNMVDVEFKVIEAEVAAYDKLESKKGYVANIYKTILFLTIYGYRNAASAFAAFLYNQYKLLKMSGTSEFTRG